MDLTGKFAIKSGTSKLPGASSDASSDAASDAASVAASENVDADEGPQEEMNEALEDLHLQISQVRFECLSDFANFERDGFQSLPLYYIHMYGRLITAMNEVSRDVDGQEGRALEIFNNGVGALERMQLFANENIQQLDLQRKFHYKLWTRVTDLARSPMVSYNAAIGDHIRHMAVLAASIAPRFEHVWANGDLVTHKKFRIAFSEFQRLQRNLLQNDGDIRDYVFQSQQVLREACLGLRIPLAIYHIQDDLFDDETRPTYVDFSCHSDEYRYGQGRRPGVLDLKLKLGGTITDDERARLNQAKENPLKRSAPDDSEDDAEQPPSKKTAQEGDIRRGYSMAMVNVDADIGEIYRDANLNVAGWVHYQGDDVLTRTVTNRPDTIASYRTDINKILKRLRKDYCQPENLPANQADRQRLIDRIVQDIPRERNYIQARCRQTTSFGVIKDARIRAYGLRLLRCFHIKLLLASNPPVPEAEMTQALIDRLDDWILFEEIWTAGDVKSQAAPKVTAKKKAFYDPFITARQENITNWRELQRQLRGEPAGEGGDPAGGGKSGGKSGSGSGGGSGSGSSGESKSASKSSSKSASKGASKGATKSGGAAADDSADGDDLFGDPNSEVDEDDLFDDSVMAERTRIFRGENYAHFPQRLHQLQAMHPLVTVHINEKEERRHKELRIAHSSDKAPNRPGGSPRSVALRARFTQEDQEITRIVDIFRTGGPQDFQHIPIGTIFEQLTFMVVLTHWRFFQARLMLRQGPSYPL